MRTAGQSWRGNTYIFPPKYGFIILPYTTYVLFLCVRYLFLYVRSVYKCDPRDRHGTTHVFPTKHGFINPDFCAYATFSYVRYIFCTYATFINETPDPSTAKVSIIAIFFGPQLSWADIFISSHTSAYLCTVNVLCWCPFM